MRYILLFVSIVIFIQTQAQNANLAMYNAKDPETYYLSTNKSYSIPFAMVDKGTSFSRKVKYSYAINNGTPVHQQVTVDHNHASNAINAVGLSAYRVAFTTPVSFSTPGTYTLKVWIDSIDGFADANHSNDTLIRYYKAMTNVPPRMGLTEYAMHVSCGPCGESGTPYFDYLLKDLSPYTVSVKLHSYNGTGAWAALNCPEAIEIDDSIGSIAHPDFTFNRWALGPYFNPNYYVDNFFPDLQFRPTDSAFFIRDIDFFNKVPVEFAINNTSLNTSNNQLSFQLKATFPAALTFSKETRISCMLVEDSIWGYQYDNGLPAVDSGFHRYMLRKVYGGAWGKSGSVPTSIAANQMLTFTFFDTLKPEFNKSRLYLIPTIQNYNGSAKDREILNVRLLRLQNQSQPNSIQENDLENGLQLYPNPSNGYCYLESTNGSAIKGYSICSIDGKCCYATEIVEQINASKILVNTSGLGNGVYFVKVSMQNGLECTLRLIVQ